MPSQVQSIPTADPQIQEILKKSLDTEKGGTVYGPIINKGGVTNDGPIINNGAVTHNGATTLAGDTTISGDVISDIKIKKSTPALRLKGTEGSGKDWRLVEDAGKIKVQENTGSEGSPTWTTRVEIDNTGIISGIAAPAFGRVVKTDGDFTTTSGTMVDVTGLSITITTRARRCRVSVAGCADNSSASAINKITIGIDGSDVVNEILNGSEIGNASFTFVTDVLSAGSHTFKVRACASSGTLTFRGSGTTAAIFTVEETELAS
jgi:hypothetical protein